jgi:hypothetical protein
MDRTWASRAAQQAGMLSQSQLNCLEVSRGFVRNQLRAGRWAQRTSSVFSTTTGPLSEQQRLWLGVLHAGPTALLGGLTAAEQQGLKGWRRESTTVLVDDELSFDPVDGIDFFRTRRPLAAMRDPSRALPTCRLEPAVLLFGGYERNRRTAHGLLAAVVQQRLTTVDALDDWLREMRPLRRAPEIRSLFADLRGGAQSRTEVDLSDACREFRVALPVSQRPRQDRAGRTRFTDAEWRLTDGTVLVLEVDGAFHDDVLQGAADRTRQRRLTSRSRLVVSCSAFELRYTPGEVMHDLIALGVPRS